MEAREAFVFNLKHKCPLTVSCLCLKIVLHQFTERYITNANCSSGNPALPVWCRQTEALWRSDKTLEWDRFTWLLHQPILAKETSTIETRSDALQAWLGLLQRSFWAEMVRIIWTLLKGRKSNERLRFDYSKTKVFQVQQIFNVVRTKWAFLNQEWTCSLWTFTVKLSILIIPLWINSNKNTSF